MVILQATHRFLPEHIGGIAAYTLNLSTQLSKRHQVHVFSCLHEEKYRGDLKQDIEYQALRVRRAFCECQLIRPRSIATFRNEPVSKAFEKYLVELNPDIVHVQHSDDLPVDIISISKEHNVPVVVTLHDYTFICPTEYLIDSAGELCDRMPGVQCLSCVVPDPFSKFSRAVPQRILSKIAALCYRLLPGEMEGNASYTMGEVRALKYRMDNLRERLLQADMIIAPSDLLKNRAAKFGIPQDQIIHILNGIRDGHIPTKDRKDGKIRFGFIGRVVPIKGVHILMQAFGKLDNSMAELRIYGSVDDTYVSQLRDLASRSRNVFFLGRFEPHQLYRVLSEIDVVVMPSICCENMPLVVLEALAAKTPVIASRVGGLAEIVRNGENGFLFQMGDAEDLHEKMRIFVEDPGVIAEISENIKPVKSIEENAVEVESVYMSLLDSTL